MEIHQAFSGNFTRIFLILSIMTIISSILSEGHTSRFSKNSFAALNLVAEENQEFEEGHTRVKRQTRPCPLPSLNCNSDPYLYKFRRIDGTCNNLNYPYCGGSHLPFDRWLSRTPSGSAFRCPLSRCARPRDITVAMNKCPQAKSDGVTLVLMQWGQFIDHDLVITPETEGVTGCCQDFRTVTTSSPNCVPIDVRGDVFYGSVGTTVNCLPFVRSKVAPCTNTGNRETINENTPYLDASMIYGSTDAVATEVKGLDGFLKVGLGTENFSCPKASDYDFCPSNFLPTTTSTTTGNTEFFAGDIRVEEQPSLTSIHTLFLRCHNYFVKFLKYCNTDELKYQAARKIVGAIVQQITFGEFLPALLGENVMKGVGYGYGLPLSLDYSYSYDSSICVEAPNVFSTAALRVGHTFLPDEFRLSNNKIIKLAESFNNHGVTINTNSLPSHFLGGIILQSAMPADQFIVPAVHNFLFAQGPNFRFGEDLPARNIQRGRDHGIAGYTKWRNICVDNNQYKTVKSFDDLYGKMPDCVVDAFIKLYETVEDIEIFPAGIAEYSEKDIYSKGGIIGPTFSCIIAEFFSKLKYGDRFWFQNKGVFTTSQVQSISKTSLAALICMFTNVEEIQPKVMFPPTDKSGSNPLTLCTTIIQNSILYDIIQSTSIWDNVCA